MSYSGDMTEGKISRQIISFTLPLLAGNILQQLYNIADTFIVGKYLGDNAIAAVGATGSITYLFYTLCYGLATGAGILISQHYGAKNINLVKTVIVNSAYVTFLFGILISLISVLFSEKILLLLGTPAKLMPQAVGYMRVSCAGTLAVAAYNWINSVLRSLGDSKTPLVFLGIASVINIVLDLVFVVSFDMGVNGAAYATVIAQGISAISCIVYALYNNQCFMKLSAYKTPDKSVAVKCIEVGVPIAVQNGLISVSMVALQHVTNTFGENVMTAYTVSMRIEQLVQQPFSSLNAAVSVFTGQNIGAGHSKRAINGYKEAAKIASIFSICILAVFMVFSRSIFSIFSKDETIIAIGMTAVRMTSLFYILLGVIHVTRGFLNGIGDTGYAMVNGGIEVTSRVVFSLILTGIPFIGKWGIWGTTCLTWTLTAVFSYIRYRKDITKFCN